MSRRAGDARLSYRDRLLTRITVDLDGTRPVDDAPCWTWTGCIKGNGYGYFREQLAHCLVFAELRGEIPAGLELDHLCRNHSCVNPAHLEPVTHEENCRRGLTGEVARARMLGKTHCVRNHEFTPENTKQTPRQRKCRQCIREDSMAARARRKLDALPPPETVRKVRLQDIEETA